MAKRMAVKNKTKRNRKSEKRDFSKLKKIFVKAIFSSAFILVIVFSFSELNQIWNTQWTIKNIAIAGENKHISHQYLMTLFDYKKVGILSVDIEALKAKTQKNPWIKSIEIKKKWPDTLVFDITEHLPKAIVNNNYMLENGRLVNLDGREVEYQLIKLSVDNKQLTNSKNSSLLVASLIDVKTKFSAAGLIVEEFIIDFNSSWSVELTDSFSINVGRKNQVKRLDRFLDVYSSIEDKHLLDVIDLRYSNGIAVKLVENQTEKKRNG